MSIKEYLTEGVTDSEFMRTVKQIEKMTDRNDHSGAAIAGAKLLDKAFGGYSKTVKVLEHLQEIHKLYGSMPYELGQFRYSTLKLMWKDADKKLSKEQSAAFNGAY
jgi:hypothetical protein